MRRACSACGVLLLSAWGAAGLRAAQQDIIQRSVENTNEDWAAAPRYTYTEHDVIIKNGKKTEKTYEVMMIEGSPYNKVLAINGRRISPAQAAVEDRKLQQEIARRRNETPSARQKRVAAYERERRQDHELLREMVRAFNFKPAGEEDINGRRCFVFTATPRPEYQPVNRSTKVLKGMRGKLWIDTQQEQWVRVQAEVFRPVAFGLFIAQVQPGTEFTLEQKPVQGNIWLPSRFSTRVKARVFLMSRNSSDDEDYSNYRQLGAAPADSRGTKR